ncbi:MMS19 nucleotide excision repair protein-like protein [Platysternon megacephalum]|uniref:MMS19 nucleotide excision repair protein n=1 Tax=Platysternon megacephalum TaxID=55544 RepID=A0A4D9ELY5_9SAUR|nr:MMS19 nucleotide excision repair protein-like protein [Platysternon megacephalum]
MRRCLAPPPQRIMAAAGAGAEGPGGALRGWVRDFVSGLQDGRAAEVAAGVKAGSWTILEIVEALGSCLENTEPHTRGRGLQLLSQVLLQCHSVLQEEEVTHLVLFYENRLKDHHLVIPAVLQGLHALVSSLLLLLHSLSGRPGEGFQGRAGNQQHLSVWGRGEHGSLLVCWPLLSALQQPLSHLLHAPAVACRMLPKELKPPLMHVNNAAGGKTPS